MPYWYVRPLAAPVLINDTGGYMVVIAGQPAFVVAGTLTIECAIGRRSQASFTIYTASLSTHVQQYQQVQIYDATGYLVFSGYVTNPTENKPGYQPSILTTITCADQHFLADKRILAAAYQNQTPAQIVANIVSTVLAAEGVTVGQIYDPFPALFVSLTTIVSTSLLVTASSNAIPNAVFGYCTVAAALDALVQSASSSGIPYYWQIDQFKQLWFVPYTMITGPAVDGTIIDEKNNPPSVTRANPTYRNVQYIVSGTAQTLPQTETRLGDGNTVAWPMGFDLSMVPTISVDGNPKTVGINGIDAGKDFYWNKGDKVITQDSAAAKLTASNVLQVYYIGQYPTVIASNNAAQIAQQTGLDGTSGIIEDVEEDATITSLAGGYAEAGNLLTRYSTQGIQVQATVKQPGFVQGQFCQTNLPMFGINNLGMLLESISITDSVDGFSLWYKLNLIAGPSDTSWQSFWGNLIGTAGPVSDLSVGSSSSLALSAPFTATLAPSASMTPTVFACPIVNTTTFANTTTIVC